MTHGLLMRDFLLAFEWFFYGFVAGMLTVPVFKFLTQLLKEYKIAKLEWHNPHRRSNDEHAP